MNKQKKLVVAAALSVILIVLSACSGKQISLDLGKKAEQNTIVSAKESFEGQTIRKVEVEWVSGSVEITTGDAVSYEADEEADLPEKRKMGYELKGDTLTIKEYNESWSFSLSLNFDDLKDYEAKNLKLVIPTDLQELEIETVSADVNMDTISVHELDVESVSAYTYADELQAEEIEIKTVSGDTDLALKEAAREINTESVSGNLTLRIPESIGFTVETETVSGDAGSDLTLSSQDGLMIHGDGEMKIKMYSVSGDLSIYEKK